MFSFLFLEKMSHWLNHDAFAIDRHARRHQDRQMAWNAVGAGVVGAAAYAGGRYFFSSPKKSMPSTYRSGYQRLPRRPQKRRRSGSDLPLTPPQSERKKARKDVGNSGQVPALSFPENNSGMPARNARQRAVRGRARGAGGRFARRRPVRRLRRVVVYRKKSSKKLSRSSRSKFSAKRRQKTVSYSKMGSVLTREDGGTISDTQCVYIGHSIAFFQVFQSVCRAVIRELFRQKGELIVDWTDHWLGAAGEMTISYKYKYPSANSLDQVNLALTAATSYAGLADLLRLSIIGNFTGVNTGQVIYDVWLRDTAAPTVVHGLVNFNQCTFYFFVKSTLKVQNATHAADVLENDQYTDIHNRPVVGKVYHSKRQLSGFLPNSRPLRGSVAEVGYQSFLGDFVGGLIKASSSLNCAMQTKKPPPGYFFNANATFTKLAPGQIRRYSWIYNKKMNGSNFLQKFCNYVNLAHTGVQSVPIGPAQMIGLEKEIDIRTADESSVVVGYQLDQSYCCALRKHAPKATTIMDITTV